MIALGEKNIAHSCTLTTAVAAAAKILHLAASYAAKDEMQVRGETAGAAGWIDDVL